MGPPLPGLTSHDLRVPGPPESFPSRWLDRKGWPGSQAPGSGLTVGILWGAGHPILHPAPSSPGPSAPKSIIPSPTEPLQVTFSSVQRAAGHGGEGAECPAQVGTGCSLGSPTRGLFRCWAGLGGHGPSRHGHPGPPALGAAATTLEAQPDPPGSQTQPPPPSSFPRPPFPSVPPILTGRRGPRKSVPTRSNFQEPTRPTRERLLVLTTGRGSWARATLCPFF